MVATLERELRKLQPKSNKRIELLRDLCRLIPPEPITSKQMHERYQKVLELVLGQAAALENRDSRGALAEYASMIGKFVEEYEKHVIEDKSSSREVLEFLMEQHSLAQSDLGKELGGQPVVSDILHGKRELNANQIQSLAHRFNVSPAAFYPL